MKKINVVQLIASLCMLVGCIINLLKTFVKLPLVLTTLSMPLLIVAAVLFAIDIARQVKNIKK